MPTHNRATIISMTVIASAAATLLHEGLGHGVVAWLRGAGPTELTTTHLSSLKADRWVMAGGTLVNLAVGAAALFACSRSGQHANRRYFLWLLGALNLLPGAGYFMYSGLANIGDWAALIRGLPHHLAWRIALSLFGVVLYYLSVRAIGATVAPFAPDGSAYNVAGRLPYWAGGIFQCIAGLLDPLGWRLLLIATIAAAFGGNSGLLWANVFLPQPAAKETLTVRRSPGWWITAVVFGGAYILIVGPGIRFHAH
ncbi:MAG: hypothetical protein DMG65_13400 [Candidatus Angelobacter sp. Gp1-AA117]|nr:MAG: hypothetical protein DMG65_13400 [Candidatus Angelobacter sp. Gp1-AA117]